MQNGKLGSLQRKAFIQLVQNAYNRRIEKQRRLYDEALAIDKPNITLELLSLVASI